MRANGRPNAYQANQVNTVSKSKLILLMYDGALRFVTEARQRTEMKDIPGRGLYISKAQKIINELAASLDRNKGGEVAGSLDRLYTEISRNLTEANIKGDPERLELVIRMLRTTREAWEQVIENSGAERKAPGLEKQNPGVAINC